MKTKHTHIGFTLGNAGTITTAAPVHSQRHTRHHHYTITSP
ncbi:MAG: hypothetical protein PUI61_03470 [Bacteroidales bacterium]|nr:hypothetical protein [Bacteroidales bacterium]